MRSKEELAIIKIYRKGTGFDFIDDESETLGAAWIRNIEYLHRMADEIDKKGRNAIYDLNDRLEAEKVGGEKG